MTKFFKTTFYTRRIFDTNQSCQELFEQLCANQLFIPDKYGKDEPVRILFDCNQLGEPINILSNKKYSTNLQNFSFGSILLKKAKPKIFFSIKWSRNQNVPFEKSNYTIASSYIKRNSNLLDWINFLLPLLEIQDSWFASFCLEEEEFFKHRFQWVTPNNVSRKTGYVPGLEIESFFGNKLEKNIPGIYWGTYFGSNLVNTIGREKFDLVDYPLKIVLPKGGVFFTTSDTPFNWMSPQSKSLQNKIAKIIGEEKIFNPVKLRQDLETKLGVGDIYDPEQLIPQLDTYFPLSDKSH